MCGVCGCSEHMISEKEHVAQSNHLHIAHHHHDATLVHIEQDIFAKNNQHAKSNQDYFSKNKIVALNIMSSPGSGKTTLLAKTIADLKSQIDIAVVVGDQQTNYDAQILKASGALAIQVNTGKVCHLDAHMINHALEQLTITNKQLLFIENVGNLVCPALFNLGEHFKIVILSVTEGDNKPLKYPEMFRCADLLILTKTDLLPYVDFDIEKCINYAHRIKPNLDVLELSATKGDGLSKWYDWLIKQQQ